MHFCFGSFDFHLYNCCCCCCLWFNDDANKFWYQTIDEWFLIEYSYIFLLILDEFLNFVEFFFIESRFFYYWKMTTTKIKQIKRNTEKNICNFMAVWFTANDLVICLPFSNSVFLTTCRSFRFSSFEIIT